MHISYSSDLHHTKILRYIRIFFSHINGTSELCLGEPCVCLLCFLTFYSFISNFLKLCINYKLKDLKDNRRDSLIGRKHSLKNTYLCVKSTAQDVCGTKVSQTWILSLKSLYSRKK